MVACEQALYLSLARDLFWARVASGERPREETQIESLTFSLLRDSSDLHIYKDLYGGNNYRFCNLWKCSDLNKNRLTLL